jgi:hypothetical protein
MAEMILQPDISRDCVNLKPFYRLNQKDALRLADPIDSSHCKPIGRRLRPNPEVSRSQSSILVSLVLRQPLDRASCVISGGAKAERTRLTQQRQEKAARNTAVLPAKVSEGDAAAGPGADRARDTLPQPKRALPGIEHGALEQGGQLAALEIRGDKSDIVCSIRMCRRALAFPGLAAGMVYFKDHGGHLRLQPHY